MPARCRAFSPSFIGAFGAIIARIPFAKVTAVIVNLIWTVIRIV